MLNWLLSAYNKFFRKPEEYHSPGTKLEYYDCRIPGLISREAEFRPYWYKLEFLNKTYEIHIGKTSVEVYYICHIEKLEDVPPAKVISKPPEVKQEERAPNTSEVVLTIDQEREAVACITSHKNRFIEKTVINDLNVSWHEVAIGDVRLEVAYAKGKIYAAKVLDEKEFNENTKSENLHDIYHICTNLIVTARSRRISILDDNKLKHQVKVNGDVLTVIFNSDKQCAESISKEPSHLSFKNLGCRSHFIERLKSRFDISWNGMMVYEILPQLIDTNLVMFSSGRRVLYNVIIQSKKVLVCIDIKDSELITALLPEWYTDTFFID